MWLPAYLSPWNSSAAALTPSHSPSLSFSTCFSFHCILKGCNLFWLYAMKPPGTFQMGFPLLFACILKSFFPPQTHTEPPAPDKETNFDLNNSVQGNSCLMGTFSLSPNCCYRLPVPVVWRGGCSWGWTVNTIPTPVVPHYIPSLWLQLTVVWPVRGLYFWCGCEVIWATLCTPSAAVESKDKGLFPFPWQQIQLALALAVVHVVEKL